MKMWPFSPKKEPKNELTPFKTVLLSGFLAEYRGALPATGKFGVRHNFFCSEVRPEHTAALLAQGFDAIAGHTPTHVYLCHFYLNKDAGSTRCLFNVAVDLSSFEALHQTYIALEIARGIKSQLLQRDRPDFLIRCRDENEFPFCVDDSMLDLYWYDWVLAYFRGATR